MTRAASMFETNRMLKQIRFVGRRVRTALQIRGPIGTLEHYAKKSVLDFQATMFDLMHHVETGGAILVRDLQTDSPNRKFGFKYQGTPPWTFHKIMKQLALPWEQFSFIDIGSGKGRVVLLASDLPFRRIVGVEFSSDLTDIARRNLRTYRSSSQRCSNLDLLCADAAAYEFPDEPLLIYFSNPFDASIMQAMLSNIESSLRRKPRPAWMIYHHPTVEGVLETSRLFDRVQQEHYYHIYRGKNC
jgi:SAM-dependent methyltransferase